MKIYSTITKYYDQYGNSYDTERNRTYYYDFINKIEINAVINYLPDSIALEIGCGTGIILEETRKYAKSIYGVDLSVGMLKDAKKKDLKVINANAVNLPFNNLEFDLVYSFKVLPHIPEIKKVVKEIHRILKDDGVAILEFYNPYSLKCMTNWLLRAENKVFTRFDNLKNIQKLINGYFYVTEIIGARIITPVAVIHKLPLINSVIQILERRLSRTYLNRFSGYFIVVLRKYY